MRKADVVLGEVYAVKVSGRIIPVRIRCTSSFGGWYCTNVITGNRTLLIKTAARLRYVWTDQKAMEDKKNADNS